MNKKNNLNTFRNELSIVGKEENTAMSLTRFSKVAVFCYLINHAIK